MAENGDFRENIIKMVIFGKMAENGDFRENKGSPIGPARLNRK